MQYHNYWIAALQRIQWHFNLITGKLGYSVSSYNETCRRYGIINFSISACFSPLVFTATGGMGPLLQLFLGSLLLCWLRSTALIAANAYSGCAADCVKILGDLFKGSSLYNETSCHNNYRPGLLQGLLGVWRPWLIVGIPSCPALYDLVLGVMARAIHLAWEKKNNSITYKYGANSRSKKGYSII